ncbi:TPA: hypothetical protein ACOEA6_004692, partial [Enterobacter kobei]
MPLRTTPSVAEQEGQLIETEATGAPQKHHHTLASPTKGCLIANFATVPLFAPSLAKAKKSAQKILEKKSVSADTASAGCAYFRTMDSHPLRDGENELAALQQ